MNMALWNDEQHRPLQHIRVIDTSVMLPGPLLTRILAQHGADVIKVEKLPGEIPSEISTTPTSTNSSTTENGHLHWISRRRRARRF